MKRMAEREEKGSKEKIPHFELFPEFPQNLFVNGEIKTSYEEMNLFKNNRNITIHCSISEFFQSFIYAGIKLFNLKKVKSKSSNMIVVCVRKHCFVFFLRTFKFV
jgi:hypothetical protein